jgi:periplasmic protein TonB
MTGLRVILGVTASIGLHVGSMLALGQSEPPKQREKKPAVVELTALPPPAPEPEPPKEMPPRKPEEPKPEWKRPTQPRPAAEPAPEPQRDIPSTSAPLVLAGLSMSNAGVGVTSSYGASPSPPRAPSETSAPRQIAAPPPAAQTLTPVSDLSKKPVPPRLDSALVRFYPPGLRNQGIEGEAMIRVVLAKDGKVAQTSAVSESHPGFAPACEKALRTSHWEAPIDKSGNPTMTALKYRCRFRVNL